MLKALIIGGGIGGLSTAIALNRRGIATMIFERANEIGEVGAGISLWANAIKAIRELGLGDKLSQMSRSQMSGGLRSWRGGILTGALPSNTELTFDGPLVIVVHRAELHAALLQSLNNDSIRLGYECTEFEQTSEGVTARFANGSEERGDFLIGADGINSVVRAQLFGKSKPRYSGYTAWRAVVGFDHRKLPYTEASETWGCGARFGLVPMSGDRLYWFATKNAPEGERDAASGRKQELLDLFHGWHEPVESVIEATEENAILRNDIYDREPITSWTKGRVTLLGDAAHPMTPNLGQGGCQAIEDAVAIARTLAKNQSVESSLREYELCRVKRANKIVKQSWNIGRIAQWENPLACAARNALLSMIPASTQLKRLEWIIGGKA